MSLLAELATRGKVIGLDHSTEMVKLSKHVNRKLVETGRVEILHGEVSSLPFSDGMFDSVTAFDTFYFWPNQVEDLREVFRVVRPGGKLLLFNEWYRKEVLSKRGAQFEKATGIRLQTPEENRELLLEAGYSKIDTTVNPDKDWFLAVAEKA